jgi:hypothetical protein
MLIFPQKSKGGVPKFAHRRGQDEIEDIVAQLQNLQIRESELLQRLERLNEANQNTSGTPIGT